MPHRCSSPPRWRAGARIAASTARQWRRSDAEETHDSNVESASSRESCSGGEPAVIAVRNDSRVRQLEFHERAAAAEPTGLLILHHGRGADELDLLGLAHALDPARRLHVAAPRGPLRLPRWPGYHWDPVPRVGYPDAASFHAAYDGPAAFHASVL